MTLTSEVLEYLSKSFPAVNYGEAAPSLVPRSRTFAHSISNLRRADDKFSPASAASGDEDLGFLFEFFQLIQRLKVCGCSCVVVVVNVSHVYTLAARLSAPIGFPGYEGR